MGCSFLSYRALLAVVNLLSDLLKQLWELSVFGLQCLLKRASSGSHIPTSVATMQEMCIDVSKDECSNCDSYLLHIHDMIHI